jgi:hypothetical protein
MKIVDKYSVSHPVGPGQYRVMIGLSTLKTMTVAEALEKLEHLGYTPELRYMQNGELISLFALLLDEQHDPTHPIPDLYREEESTALFEAFENDDLAVYISRGLPKRQPASLAS